MSKKRTIIRYYNYICVLEHIIMNTYKLFATLLSITLLSFNLNATTITSVQDGDWSDDLTWDDIAPLDPNCYDTIIINHYVELDVQADLENCSPITVIVSDTLFFVSGKKLSLPLGSTFTLTDSNSVVIPGSGGSSNLIDIGSTTVWNSSADIVEGPSVTDGTTPLPIVLLSLNYDYFNKILIFETATEINNDYFTINVGSIYSDGLIVEDKYVVSGSGNSNSIIRYEFDLNVCDKYVELWQTDYDGSTVLLNTIYPHCDNDNSNITISPNPSFGDVNINGEFQHVQVYNIFGKEMKVNLVNNKISGLQKGVYIVVIDSYNKIKLIIS